MRPPRLRNIVLLCLVAGMAAGARPLGGDFAAARALSAQDDAAFRPAPEPGAEAASATAEDPPAEGDRELFETLLQQDDAFRIARPGEEHAAPLALQRNPFLLLVEQQSQQAYATLRAEEAARRREAEAQGAQAGGLDPERRLDLLAQQVARLRLSAIMLAPDGGAALIDGRTVHLGETLLDGQVTLARLTRDGAVFSAGDGGRSFTLALPPPGVQTRAAATAPGPGGALPASAIDPPEENP